MANPKRKLQAIDPETGEVYTRTTARDYGVVRILVIPETSPSYDPTLRNRIVSWHRDEYTATRSYDSPSWRKLRHVFAPVTDYVKPGDEPAVEYTVAPAPNAWTDLAPGTLIEAVPSGTKADGTPITRPIRQRLDRDPWGYDAVRGTYVVSDGTGAVVVVADSVRVIEPVEAEPVMVVPSAEFTAYVTKLGQRAREAGAAVAAVTDALPVRDHGKCAPNTHTREAGDNTRQRGDQDSDGQLVDSNGEMLCNDCEQPLVYCEEHDVYVHLDPDTPPCFLVHEALPTMDCEGCGGVFRTRRWWDGSEIRYADPECAEMLHFTELSIVTLADTVSENFSASGADLSTTHAEVTAAGETLASFDGPVSEEFDVAEWDQRLADAGFRRVGFWNLVEYTAPVARLAEPSSA